MITGTSLPDSNRNARVIATYRLTEGILKYLADGGRVVLFSRGLLKEDRVEGKGGEINGFGPGQSLD